MQLKLEASKLIKQHFEEIASSAQELGGVFITGMEGSVVVIGAEDREKKIIFKTGFVSENQSKLLDAQVDIQDLLEDEGIEAISEHDFNLAIGNH